MELKKEICDPQKENSQPALKASSGHKNFSWLLNSPELCPSSAVTVLHKICKTMGLKYPAILVEAVRNNNGNVEQIYEAYCIVDTLMCVALGKSPGSAFYGAYLRMAVNLMGYVTMENLQDLEDMCKQDGDMSTEDISMLRGVMEFAQPEEFCEDVNAESEEKADGLCKPIEVGEAGSCLLQMLVKSDGQGDHGAGLDSADQDQEKPRLTAEVDENVQTASARQRGSDYVSTVKQYCDKHGLKPDYAFSYVEDPRNPHFEAELTLTSNDIAIEHLRAKGPGRNKRTAKRVASMEMLRMLGELVNK